MNLARLCGLVLLAAVVVSAVGVTAAVTHWHAALPAARQAEPPCCDNACPCGCADGGECDCCCCGPGKSARP